MHCPIVPSSSARSFRLNLTFSLPPPLTSRCCCRYSIAGAPSRDRKLQQLEVAAAAAAAPPSERGGGVQDPSPRPRPPPRDDDNGGGEGSSWRTPSRIQVPRQSYIPVSKTDLLDALVSMFNSRRSDDDDGSLTRHFLLLSSCLDSIIHAEHKGILEEMRNDYSLSCSKKTKLDLDGRRSGGDGKPENVFEAASSNVNGSVNSFSEDVIRSGNQMPFYSELGAMRTSTRGNQRNSSDKSSVARVATATRFQRSFMKLLSDAQFEELSVRDLLLTSALNSDYLLTLPIYVDWKKASEFNAVIFRRGYVTEKQKGLLVVEKLDYLQSKLLQEAFSIISKPLRMVVLWINKTLESGSTKREIQAWFKRVKLWIEETSQGLHSYEKQASNVMADLDHLDHDFNGDLPIWLAAQRAVSRYEGLLSSVGPRGRLLRKFLTWMGLIQSTPEAPLEHGNDDTAAVEPYLRPVSISRITLTDIWRPATTKYCGNDIWRMMRTAISIVFSRSVLQEPAFDQLILLYTEETSKDEASDNIDIPSLQLRIYEKIPIPDLPVIFPNKKLSFRILDTVRLDIATILGLLAYFINYKFEDALSSPSAVLLDAIAVSALIIFVTRVALGYKQTWDRYQLLVNKTLYTKTLASGFGSVHFLLDASEQQQYKECILAYAMLLNAENGQIMDRSTLGEKCERFLYDTFQEKVAMPINKAVDTLKKFGFLDEDTINGESVLLAIPFSTAYNDLKQRWDRLLI